MNLDAPAQLALILILGGLAQWIAWRSRVPSILLLLASGLIVGPVLGLLTPDEALGGALLPVVSLAVGFILFDGGMELTFREIRGASGVVWRLVTIGLLVTWIVALIASRYVLDLSLGLSMLVAAIVVVSGPTVVGPLLRYIRPSGVVGSVLKWEGIVIDPIGVLLTLLVFEVVLQRDLGKAPLLILETTLITVSAGVGLGLAAAWLLVESVRRFWVPDHLQNAVALVLVVGAFAGSNAIAHEAGLFATTVMGIALANQRRADIHGLQEFSESIRVILLSALFVVLAARLRVDDIRMLGWRELFFLLILVFVARPLSVLASVMRSKLSQHERGFLMCVMPRGIVAAAVSSVFAIRLQEANVAGAETLVPIVFMVIIGTVVIYSIGAPVAARKFGLAEPSARGVLFAGAGFWTRLLAIELQRLGVRVVLVDTSHPHVTACQFDRLECVEGSVLSEQTIDDLDLAGIGRLLACTPNPWINALAAKRFERIFGKAEVFRVRSAASESSGQRDETAERQTRWLFGEGVTETQLEQRAEEGQRVHAVPIEEAASTATVIQRLGAEALPMMVVSKEGKVLPITADGRRDLSPGDTLLVMSPALMPLVDEAIQQR